jgi:hypothetical protein
MESPDELYENLIKNGKGDFPQIKSLGNLTKNSLGSKLAKVSLGIKED